MDHNNNNNNFLSLHIKSPSNQPSLLPPLFSLCMPMSLLVEQQNRWYYPYGMNDENRLTSMTAVLSPSSECPHVNLPRREDFDDCGDRWSSRKICWDRPPSPPRPRPPPQSKTKKEDEKNIKHITW